MEKRRTVILCGNSLLMAGLEASLRDQPGLDVVRVDAALPNIAQRLEALHPDVLIFDLSSPPSTPSTTLRTGFQPPSSILHFPTSILQEHPGIALIGLDINSSKALALSGQEHTVLAADDLAQVIQLLTRT